MEVKEALALEERMAKVEGILEEVRTRLNHLEFRFEHPQTRFEHLRSRVDIGFGELRREMETNNRGLRQEMQGQFRWTSGIMLGVLIPMWVTIILAILLGP
ncbi:MAG: hypothetical protein AAGB97_09205 [Dehalococcoidia bacterium]